MKKTILLIVLVLTSLTACNKPTSFEESPTQPLPPITLSSTPARTPTITPTVTFTVTPSPTITETPTPTPLPSPTPTPTPEGYHISETGYFSLVCPSDWEFVDEGEMGVHCSDDDHGLYFGAVSEVIDGEYSIKDFIELLDESLGSSHEMVLEDEITLKDGTIADRAVLNYKVEGNNIIAHLAAVQKDSRAFSFMSFAPKISLAFRPDELEQIFESIEILSGNIYGLDRNKTLVLMGHEPFPEDLDPARMTDSAAHYIGHIYSGLVRLSPEMQMEPDLAESWLISPDGTEYTFTLRDDLNFQSGSQLTAEDVKYSWERAADPQTESPTAASYLGDIVGVKEKLDGEAREVEGIEVLDHRTLVVKLDGPKPYFLAKLTYPTSFIVDRENIESNPENWMFEPNASGPFGIHEYKEDEALIFKRNENYHSPANLEHVVYLLYQAGVPISYYKAGEIDITGVSSLDARNILDDAEDPLNEQMHSVTSMCTSYVYLNNTRPPMDDPNVRRALALSVNKDRLNELFSENLSLVANSILPPAMPGYFSDQVVIPHDPDGARESLTAAKYNGDLPPIVINAPGYGDEDSPYLNALIDMWDETLGVDVAVDYVDPREMMPALREADGHVAVLGWCADYPDPENFLDILFHSESLFNSSNYSNAEVDNLLEQARVEIDPDIRLALYNEVESKLLEDYAVIPITHSVDFILVNPRVHDFKFVPMGAPIIHLLSVAD